MVQDHTAGCWQTCRVGEAAPRRLLLVITKGLKLVNASFERLRVIPWLPTMTGTGMLSGEEEKRRDSELAQWEGNLATSVSSLCRVRRGRRGPLGTLGRSDSLQNVLRY